MEKWESGLDGGRRLGEGVGNCTVMNEQTVLGDVAEHLRLPFLLPDTIPCFLSQPPLPNWERAGSFVRMYAVRWTRRGVPGTDYAPYPALHHQPPKP